MSLQRANFLSFAKEFNELAATTSQDALRQDLLPHLLTLLASQESPISYRELLDSATSSLEGTLTGTDLANVFNFSLHLLDKSNREMAKAGTVQ